MRKFVIKNRPKRKYTRKNTSAPTFSFSKTIYEMLPMIILLVTFMATMVISLPFRESIAKMHITIQPPRFSFSDPISFFETIFTDIIQTFSAVGIMLSLVTTNIQQTMISVGNGSINIITLLDPRPLFIAVANLLLLTGIGTENMFRFITYEVIQGLVGIVQLFIIAGSAVALLFTHLFGSLALSIGYATSSIGRAVGNALIFVTQASFHAAIVTGETITTIASIVIHSVLYAFSILLHWLVIAFVTGVSLIVTFFTAVASAIIFVLRAILHIIEIPFKILYTFWLILKPYVDIFLRHVQMSGADLGHGFSSLGQVASAVSSTK